MKDHLFRTSLFPGEIDETRAFTGEVVDSPPRIDELQCVEGFLELGMPQEALETLNDLGGAYHSRSAAWRLRLLALTDLQDWKAGLQSAEMLTEIFGLLAPHRVSLPELRPLREAVGHFHLHYAGFLAAMGGLASARLEMARCNRVWPEGRAHETGRVGNCRS